VVVVRYIQYLCTIHTQLADIIGNSVINVNYCCFRPQVSKMVMGNSTTANWEQVDDVEVQREVFRRPRDALLCVAAEFLTNCSKRMKELGKLLGENTKIPELFDQKSHMVCPSPAN